MNIAESTAVPSFYRFTLTLVTIKPKKKEKKLDYYFFFSKYTFSNTHTKKYTLLACPTYCKI